ncbi:MAG: hypothetical protein MZV65_48090 [Chromatiales bacterium]|nr:hypothetical protein [Chromatiales bacterium]
MGLSAPADLRRHPRQDQQPDRDALHRLRRRMDHGAPGRSWRSRGAAAPSSPRWRRWRSPNASTASRASSGRRMPLLLCVAERERPGRLEGLDDQLFLDIQQELDVRFAPQSAHRRPRPRERRHRARAGAQADPRRQRAPSC